MNAAATRTSETLNHRLHAGVHWDAAIFELSGAFVHILVP